MQNVVDILRDEHLAGFGVADIPFAELESFPLLGGHGFSDRI
jgi:hypothetical protein